MARDWCDERDPTNKAVLAFIRRYLSDTETVAKGLNVRAEWILGLAATESDYGTSSIAKNANNFFGQAAGASGSIGVYVTKKGARVSKFADYKSSARSFARDFGNLVRNKKTVEEFVKSLVPKFNTTDPKTNGNPKFVEDTMGGVGAVLKRMPCLKPSPSATAHKCGAKCKDFPKYGRCDRMTRKVRCWQHSISRNVVSQSD